MGALRIQKNCLLAAVTFFWIGVEQPASADISLADYAVNLDGVVSQTLPAGSIFDTSSGLGSVQILFTAAGIHTGLFFVDHEMSESLNGFDNEIGTAVGA